MSSHLKRLPSLDGLRAVSIILVIGDHATRTADFPSWLEEYTGYFLNGGLGVRVFFVISGFLITHLLLEENRYYGRIDLLGFYKRRALRIFPVMYLFLFSMLLASLWIEMEFTAWEWVSAATFSRNYFSGSWTLGHLWSLALEEQFYIIWPFTLVLLRTRKNLIIAAVVVIMITPIIRIVIYLSPYRWLIDYAFFTQADSLMFGCALAIILQDKGKIESVLHLSPAVWRFGAVVAIYIVWILSLHGVLGMLTIPFGATIQSAAITCLIASSVLVRSGLLYSILNLPVLIWIGVLSYSLYIWQQVALYPAEYSEGEFWWRTFPENIFVVFMLAMFSYHFVEKPMLRLKRRVKPNRLIRR